MSSEQQKVTYRIEVLIKSDEPGRWARQAWGCESLGLAFEYCRDYKAKEPNNAFRVVRETDGEIMTDPLDEIEQLKAKLAAAASERSKSGSEFAAIMAALNPVWSRVKSFRWEQWNLSATGTAYIYDRKGNTYQASATTKTEAIRLAVARMLA